VGESKAGGSPTLPFPLSSPSLSIPPTSFPYQCEGRSDSVRGKFPGFPPPTNATLYTSAIVLIYYSQTAKKKQLSHFLELVLFILQFSS